MRRTTHLIAHQLEVLHRQGAMTTLDVAEVLAVPPETLSRSDQGQTLPSSEAQDVLRDLVSVVELLADLYDPADVREWLRSRQRLLEDRIPAHLIQQGRTEEVLRALRALLDGVHR